MLGDFYTHTKAAGWEIFTRKTACRSLSPEKKLVGTFTKKEAGRVLSPEKKNLVWKLSPENQLLG